MSDDHEHDDFDDELNELDEHESNLVRQDLVDLSDFETTFAAEGYRGVSMFCQDCMEDHFFPWGMLRENLELLLETGETPVHEPAFHPDPAEYVPWDYARGYVDALRDVGVHQRRDVDACPSCGLKLETTLLQANFCPRCGTTLLATRLADALADRGLDPDDITALLRETGLPGG